MWRSAAGAQQKHSTSQAAHRRGFLFGLKASKQVICFGKTQIRESRFSSAFLTGDTGQSAQTVTRIQWLSTDTRPGAFQCRAGKKKYITQRALHTWHQKYLASNNSVPQLKNESQG